MARRRKSKSSSRARWGSKKRARKTRKKKFSLRDVLFGARSKSRRKGRKGSARRRSGKARKARKPRKRARRSVSRS